MRVQEILKGGVDETHLERLRDVVGIGSASFIEQIKQIAGEGSRETERRGRLKERVTYEDVLKAVAKVRDEAPDEWLYRHGDWGKWMVLKLGRQYTGQTLKELGDSVGGMDYAAVSVGVRRFDQRLKKDNQLQKSHQAIKEMLNV